MEKLNLPLKVYKIEITINLLNLPIFLSWKVKTDEKSLNKIKEENKEIKAKEAKKKYTYDDKLCDKCGYKYSYKNFTRHYKSCNK